MGLKSLLDPALGGMSLILLEQQAMEMGGVAPVTSTNLPNNNNDNNNEN